MCQLLPPPLYGGAVVLLAIFFTGLAVVTPPIEKYIVSAEVELPSQTSPAPGGDEGMEVQNVGILEVDSRHIAAAARAAFFRTRGDGDTGFIARFGPRRLRTLSERLDIRRASENGEGRHAVLTFRDPDLQWARAFVDQLAHRLVRDWNRDSDATLAMENAIRKAKWHVQRTRHYERKARFDMEQSLNAHFQQLPSGLDGVAFSGGSDRFYPSDSSPEEETKVTSARQEAPPWQRLRDQLGSLRDELNELLISGPPSHPRVRRIVRRIEHLEETLSATSRYLARGPEVAGAAAVKPVTASSGSPTRVPVAYASARESDGDGRQKASIVPAEYRRLRERHAETIRRREAAERGLSELEARSGRGPSQASAPPLQVPRPAVSVGQLGGVPPAGPALTIGTLALLCGVFVHGWIKTLGRAPRIYSVEQLQRAVTLPLVGRISIAPMPSRVRRRAYGTWCVRAGIRTSEIVLLVGIVIFFWSVLQESPVLEQLATNPLGTIARRISGIYRG